MPDWVANAGIQELMGGAERRPAVPVLDRCLLWCSERNLLVPSVAVCLLLGNMAMLGIRVHWPLVMVLFSATYVVYILDRAPALMTQPTRRSRTFAVFCLMLFAGLGSACSLRLASLGVIAFLGLLGAAYVYPMLPGGRRLKDVPFAKPFVVSLGWVAGGVALPWLEAGRSCNGVIVALVLYRFVYLLPNLLLSDWPDRSSDEQLGIRTWALRLSRRDMVRLCRGIIMGMGMVAVASVALGLLPMLLLLDVVGLLLLLPILSSELPGKKEPFQSRLDVAMGWPLVIWLLVLTTRVA